MTHSDRLTHVNISSSDLGRLQLGALLSRTILFDDAATGTRVWEYEFENATVHKTEWYGEADFIEQVKAVRNENDGKRFGDGKAVASVPMHIWASEIAPRQRDGNDGSLKRWLNSEKGAPFRTFKGRV